MTAPEAGLRLGGRYRLVRQIAVGGMGEVWVAHDESLARDVAVKVLRPEFAGNAEFLTRLRTEARNAASLSHPNIAQLYDYGEQDGLGFLVMELINGEPMSDLLERSPVLPLDRLLAILSQTARALHAAHVSGVVHRDVKPGNILLERTGSVKITDFGVSLAANQVPMTATGMVMGTAQYLSPEQAVGRAATPSSDVYALGIIAYEALVGRRPFTGKTPVDIAVAHVNEEVPPLPSSVPPALGDLVTRMLAKDPSERPRSAAQLAKALDGLAAEYRQSPWLGSVGASRPTSPVSGPQGAVRAPAPTTPAAPARAAERRHASPPPAGAVRSRSATSRGAGPRAGTERTTPAHGSGRPPAAAPRTPSRGRPSHGARGVTRQSTTTGRRVSALGRLRRVSWQAVVLLALVVAVVIAAIIGMFTRHDRAPEGGPWHASPTTTVSLISPRAGQLAPESPSGPSAMPPAWPSPGTEPTTPKDV